MLSCVFIAALLSPVGKGLTSWLSCMRFFPVFLSLSHGCPGSGVVPDICLLTFICGVEPTNEAYAPSIAMSDVLNHYTTEASPFK